MTAARRAGRILIVDDEPDALELMCMILESAGYAVVSAADGQEAIDLLRGGLRPHLIVLDLRMPRLNGWQFRAEQVRDPALASIPVLVSTGDLGAAESAAAFGAAGFLEKPFDVSKLLATVEHLVAHGRGPSGA